ncbi:uncharacterized protein DNG_01407 [Cephalotrichum gorgonifer]|uniref:Uncharacterized protein n=1 Tax=Cephalotrichum gorgonifer TaxID=2041049 RepID=A0AAE8MSJ1_9PEZI|nr:uncharacterized protein DNG_01407 [Cephalotrichum gorgonifer]
MSSWNITIQVRAPCGNQTPAPPRVKKVQKTTRVAELEKRLNQLASQLSSAQGTSFPNTSSQAASSPAPVAPSCFGHLFPADSQASAAPPPLAPVTPSASVSDESASSPSASAGISLWPDPLQAAAMLEDFKREKAALFPFVVIPPGMSEATLRVQRPFLWKGIMVCQRFFDGTGQITAGRELLTEISRASFIEPLKSLDVLQSLQLAISWLHYCLNGFQLTNMLFLCRSLCIALRLTRDAAGPHDSAALERMRAYAGCYFLNSLIFTTEKLPDAFMNTSYLDTCCSVLQAKMEYESDLHLVHLVGIQKLAQSISLTLDGNNIALQSTRLPPTMIVDAFREQLDSYQANLPPRLQNDQTIRIRVIVAQALLHEIALLESSVMTLPDRISLLWRLLELVTTYMKVRFIGSDVYRPKTICIMTGDFIFCGQIAMKLASLRIPGWDTGRAREKLELERWIGAQKDELEEITAVRARSLWTAELQAKGLSPVVMDPFQKLVISLRGFAILLAKEMEKSAPLTPPEEPVEVVPPGYDESMPELDIDMSIFDDFHLTQIDFLTPDGLTTPPWGY